MSSLTIKVRHSANPGFTLLNLQATRNTRTRFLHSIFNKPTKNLLISLVYNATKMQKVPSFSSSTPVVKSSLIDPDGGALVDLVVAEGEIGPRTLEAESLPKVKLTKIDLEWVHVLSEGWASPLRGFMREKEYLQSLHFHCLRMEDGPLVNMSLPIVLAIDDGKESIGSSKDVGLLGPGGDLVGILIRLGSKHLSLLSLVLLLGIRPTRAFISAFACCRGAKFVFREDSLLGLFLNCQFF